MNICGKFAHLTLFSTILLVLVISTHANPVWEPDDGVQVFQAQSAEPGASTVLSDGTILSVWSDARNHDRNLYGQRLDSNGTPIWEEDGCLLVDTPANESLTALVPASDGGVTIFWRNVWNGKTLFAQHFDANGDPQWDTGTDNPNEGRPLLDFNYGFKHKFYVTSNNQNGAWIAHTFSNAENYGNYSLRMHSLLSDGNLDPIWPDTGIQIDTATVNSIQRVSLLPGGADGEGLFVTWQGPQGALMQYINSYGMFPWGDQPMDLPGGVPIMDTGALATDGGGGAFIVTGTVDTIFVSRVISEGTLLWSHGMGRDAGFSQFRPGVVASDPGSVIVVWEVADGFEIHARRVGGDTYTEYWAEDAVLEWSTRQYFGSDGSGGLICDYFNDDYVYLQHVDVNGTSLLTPAQLLLHTSSGGLNDYLPTSDGRIIAVWAYNIYDDYDPHYVNTYAQVYDPQILALLLPLNGFALTTGSVFGPSNTAMTIGFQRAWFAWGDRRPLPGDGDVYGPYRIWIQALNLATGTPLFPDDIQVFLEREDISQSQAVRPISVTDAIIISAKSWNDGIVLQKISSGGQRLWGDNGTYLNIDQPHQQVYDQILLSDGSGGCIMAARFHEDLRSMIITQRFGPDGEHLWSSEGDDFIPVYISEPYTPGGVYPLELLSLNDESVACVYFHWDSEVQANQIRVSRLSMDGEILSDSLAHEARSIEHESVQTVKMNGDLLIAWQDYNDFPYVLKINSSGTPIWNQPIPFTDNEPVSEFIISSSTDTSTTFWCSWIYQSTTVRAQLYDQDGTPLLQPNEGITLSDGGIITEFDVSVKEDNSVWAAWQVNDTLDTDIAHRQLLSDGTFAPGCELGPAVLVEAMNDQEKPSIMGDGDGGIFASWLDYRGSQGLYAQRFDGAWNDTSEYDDYNIPVFWDIATIYPNPFNPTTSISFTLNRSAHVRVRVYNMQGQRVATMQDGILNAGEHILSFDGSGLASGMYFVTLEEPSKSSITRKILLVK